MSVSQSISLFIVVMAAFIAPFVSRYTKMPVVAIEILVGIILGPTVLNIVSHSEFMRFLAEFGFLLLMFYVGLEIDVMELNKKLIILNTMAFLINLLLSFILIKVFNLNFAFVAVFVSVSVGIVVGVLKELGILNSNLGKIILYSGIIQEFIVLMLATSYEIYKGEGYSVYKYVEIVLSISMAILFFRVVRVLHWWYPKHFSYFSSSSDPLSLRIRFALTIMLLSVSFAFYFHIDPVVGAFIAGFIISLSFSNVEMIKKDIETIGMGFFIPLFFVYTGINTQIEIKDLPFAVFIVFLMFFSHLGSVLIFYFNGFSIFKSTLFSLNLTKGVSIAVLLMTIAKTEGLINQRIFSLAILVSILAEIFYTVLFKVGYKNIIVKEKQGERTLSPY